MITEEMIRRQREFYSRPLPLGEKAAVRVLTPRNRHLGILAGAELPGRMMLDIDPGGVFGDGAHESTRLCAALLERYVNPGDRLLDLGCGTGILSLLGLKLGAASALGVDIREEAVRLARHNARLNGLEGAFTARTGDLARGITGRFDLITANLLPEPLLRLAPRLWDLLTPGGTAILGGIREGREGDIRAAAPSLELLEQRAEGPWTALVLRKEKP